jgi:class 3 adenylate cyclase
MPWVMAAVSALGWILAPIIWGVVWPLLTGQFSWERLAHSIVGNTVIGGTITVVVTFFIVEHLWRRRLPAYFPRGDLSAVPGVPRLRVRARLLAVFLIISVVPLLLMAALTWTRASLMVGAEPATAAALRDNMLATILFLLGVGIVAAVGLAVFVSRSVAAPLRDVEVAMARVAGGDLDVRAPVVSNDEIGAVAEGFNRMVAGLRDRERIRETFGKYVTPEVRDEILAGRVSFDGQMREVTILFCDLRDFTPWVESHRPDEVVRDINAYFTLMEGAIRAHGGLVVQFIGDEIEAVFGAPVADPRHADHAVAAALEMCRRLEAWNAERQAARAIPLRHGIGVHTGEVLAASVGSPDRLSYALVGDPVNLASRIQGLTKEVGGTILVSGETVRRLKEPVELEPLPAVRVKGRMAEVEVYRAA